MIAIIDYEMGNLQSVVNAFEFLGYETCISKDRKMLQEADALVLPGVGAFEDGMKNLEKDGLADFLFEEVVKKGKPFLGICLGMQLLAEEGFEGGQHKGLGWIKGKAVKLETGGKKLRLPHIGWNNITVKKEEPLFSGIREDFNFYFVHSFHLDCDSNIISATCDYSQTFAAAIQKDNIFATQFHPEKSHAIGLSLLKNFADFVKGNGEKNA